MRKLTIAAVAALLLAGCAPGGAAPASEAPSAPAVEVSVPADPDEALALAVRNGDVAGVEAALDRGADPDLDMGSGVTALVAAVRRDDAALVSALAAAGAELDAQDRDGYTALHRAGEAAGYDVVIALLEAGADPTVLSTDVYAGTALHWAAFKDNVDAIQAFVDAGVPIDIRNETFDATPLHLAAFGDAANAVEALLALGADPHALQIEGHTPLVVAQLNGRANAAAILERVSG